MADVGGIVADNLAATAHLRRKALARGPRQTRDTYGMFEGDPQRHTLCGEPPTTRDMAWSEVRVATSPNFAYVTCEGCRSLRFPDA